MDVEYPIEGTPVVPIDEFLVKYISVSTLPNIAFKLLTKQMVIMNT